MKSSPNKSFLADLRSNARKFEHYNINAVQPSFLKRILRNLLLYIVAFILACLITSGFDKDFISFLSTVLSILIGLFLTSLIFALDKFYEPFEEKIEDLQISVERDNKYKDYKISIKHLIDSNARKRLWHNQAYNYVLKYTYITGQNIVLSIYTLLLLFLSSLFPKILSISYDDYELQLTNLCVDECLNFIKLILVFVQRFLILYWSLKVFRNTLFVISSMVNFMTTKINRTLNK